MIFSPWSITTVCACALIFGAQAHAVIEAESEPTAATQATEATRPAEPAKPAPAAVPASSVRPGEIKIVGLGNNSALNIAILLTFLTLIPSILLCVTPFARLLVVFHFLRQALGLQTTPSNQTLIGLALILTFFLMQPVGASIMHNSVEPFQQGRIRLPFHLSVGR